ncbi:kinase-like domain-containing protein [Xylariaceae sp. FL0255]|nr:kinase-like domain-containing protein [Xylariaceae sp. FL0255]
MSNARKNQSQTADIYRDQLFAQGTFKNVYRGEYTSGPRAGQECVAKEFKTGSVYAASYFAEEMKIIQRTQKIIDDWHDANTINKRILLNSPEIWTYEYDGAKSLLEPMIENFEKFNSNSGWADGQGGVWSDAMQALSHFSYHNTGGQLLLCDLQGGSYQNGYILSDPVIMSQMQSYGPTDLGPDGIRSFFVRHTCNKFCKSWWQKPKYQGKANIPMRKGTTMAASHLPTRGSRMPLSGIIE